MIRLIKMRDKWYACEINLQDNIEDIEIFVDSGDLVVLVDELETALDKLNLDESDIEIVEP
ncbi:MAG: hypothetical protein KAT68_17280 [Bacteroidales bacterium]|nr:hypothetical protein [Bacteroidales bacterium]